MAKAPPTRTVKAGRSGHAHYLDGQKVPGVTTILSNGVPKPGLIGWSGGVVADFVANRLSTATNERGDVRICADDLVRDALEWNATRTRPEQVPAGDPLPRLALARILQDIRFKDLDEASNRGTEVHGYAERLARGEEVIVPEALAGHVRAYARFLREWHPTNAILEASVFSRRHRYGGRLDMIADFDGTWQDGPWAGMPIGRGLLDIKTSRSGIFAEVALQLEGYRNADFYLDDDGAEQPMPEVDWVGAIWVRADGYDVYAFDTDESTFRTFLYIQQVGRWLDWKEGAAATIKTDALAPPHITESSPS